MPFFTPYLVVLLSLTLPAVAAAELSPQRSEEIAHIVQQDCGSCHGLTLKGGLGPSLDPQRLQQLPESFLTITIQHGRPGTPMPPWGPLFSAEEIQYIATQLRAGTWYVP